MIAQAYGDPERAMFGLGPCGEIAYRMYKEGKLSLTKDDKEAIKAEIEMLRKRIEELEKLLKESD